MDEITVKNTKSYTIWFVCFTFTIILHGFILHLSQDFFQHMIKPNNPSLIIELEDLPKLKIKNPAEKQIKKVITKKTKPELKPHTIKRDSTPKKIDKPKITKLEEKKPTKVIKEPKITKTKPAKILPPPPDKAEVPELKPDEYANILIEEEDSQDMSMKLTKRAKKKNKSKALPQNRPETAEPGDYGKDKESKIPLKKPLLINKKVSKTKVYKKSAFTPPKKELMNITEKNNEYSKIDKAKKEINHKQVENKNITPPKKKLSNPVSIAAVTVPESSLLFREQKNTIEKKSLKQNFKKLKESKNEPTQKNESKNEKFLPLPKNYFLKQSSTEENKNISGSSEKSNSKQITKKKSLFSKDLLESNIKKDDKWLTKKGIPQSSGKGQINTNYNLNSYDWPYQSYMGRWFKILLYNLYNNPPLDYVSGLVPQGGYVAMKISLNLKGERTSFEVIDASGASKMMVDSLVTAVLSISSMPPLPKDFKEKELIFTFRLIYPPIMFSRRR